jgi:uncharacterized protein (TIGR01244 family)
MRARSIAIAGLLLVLGSVRAQAPAVAGGPAIPNARVALPGVWSGGQPSEAQIAEAAAAGFRTVINLRAPSEPGFEWEQAAVEHAGMSYVQIPVEGAAGLTRPNVERLDAALRSASERGPTLLHCASGNRIGAMLALREAWLLGTTPAKALDVGRAAGLTKLEPQVRELLGLPPDTP